MKHQILATEEGDLNFENMKIITERLLVSEVEVINMTRRLSSRDQSLNMPFQGDGEGEWQDLLVSYKDD
jgi:DNA-directed RNA polymerase sigma subunit (sigma70/sigma32)